MKIDWINKQIKCGLNRIKLIILLLFSHCPIRINTFNIIRGKGLMTKYVGGGKRYGLIT